MSAFERTLKQHLVSYRIVSYLSLDKYDTIRYDTSSLRNIYRSTTAHFFDAPCTAVCTLGEQRSVSDLSGTVATLAYSAAARSVATIMYAVGLQP